MLSWRKFGLVAGFLGWDVFNISAFIWSLRSPAKVIGTMELHPLFFLLVACISIPVTVAISGCLFWEQIRVRLPRNKLHALYEDARTLKFELLESSHYAKDPFFTTEAHERIVSLSYKLDSLGVRYPAPDPVIWIHWLPELAAWAHTKNLKAARAYKPAPPKGGSQA